MASSIAVVQGADSESIQRLFTAVATELRVEGINIAGMTAETLGLPNRSCSAGILRNLKSDERFSIYLDTQPANTSCHLDATGVEAACAAVLADLPNCKLVVLSKFGKLEAAHGGLFPAFKTAIAAGTPVLTTVSSKHLDAWKSFAPDADYLDATHTDVREWWLSVAS